MAKLVYLDNAATTKVDQSVIDAMNVYHNEKYGNASSTHAKGREAKMAMEEARHVIAKSIGAKDEEIIFTSGGTESNNFALKSAAFSNKDKGNHIITTKIEHDCVLNACKWLETQGFKVTYLDVDKEGFVSADALEKAITPKTIIVSIIHGNNEIGTIQDLKELGAVCRKHNVYFHTDACQSYTKTDINVKKQNIDLVTLNAHKIHGPKGVGALYIRKGTKIGVWQHGGGHEFGLRSGTENIPGIMGFAKSVKNAKSKYVKQMSKLRDKLIEGVLKIPDTTLNGPAGSKRLCNNTNFSFKYIEGEAIGGYLDAKGVCSSTGSACSSHSLEPSHVLMALGLKIEDAHGSLRLSLSKYNTEEEIDYVLEQLPKIVASLRKISPFTK
ncbi:IscS subfamily cysteine desulfurase [Candidatus Woesearchaeota archaeon]|nr:IscS subfamily cysteine desulfurase [Candidatus Woesearchaeota archaeon]MBW3017330.1 IscS subfamily cysteine desulfurase [Candidatus Woesearchaeota archaeon]